MYFLRTQVSQIAGLALLTFSVPALAATDKPNILVIWGDDVLEASKVLVEY